MQPQVVLWDVSHGIGLLPIDPIYGNDQIKDFFHQLIQKLEQNGYYLDVNNFGVLNLDISGYSAVVLNSTYGAARTHLTKKRRIAYLIMYMLEAVYCY